MAWKLLAMTTMILASLTECKAPQKTTVSTSSKPLTISTSLAQGLTQPKINSAKPILDEPTPIASPPPSPSVSLSRTASRPAKPLPKSVTGSRFVAPPIAPPSSNLPAGLLCIRRLESTDNYRQPGSPYGDYGGYQYKSGTWDGYGGYVRADLAPPAVQDERALADYNQGPAVRHQLWPHTSRACGV